MNSVRTRSLMFFSLFYLQSYNYEWHIDRCSINIY
jgi:hypothetical protein